MKTKRIIGIVLTAIFAVSSLFFGYMYYQDASDAKRSENTFDQLQQLIVEATPAPTQTPVPNDPGITAVPDASQDSTEAPEITQAQEAFSRYEELYARNNDFIGWITIDGTNINYPVMHSPDRPDFYLSHGFDREESSYGVPYIDEKCSIGLSNNIVVYGHRMNNGMMFHDLVNYSELSFWQSHPTIRFDTIRSMDTYEVMSAFYFDTDNETFFFNDCIDMNAASFDEYVQNCWSRQLYDTGVVATYGDTLLTLSTCDYTYPNGRFVVVARKVVE